MFITTCGKCGCTVSLEKDGGCPSVGCPMCGNSWCWSCGLSSDNIVHSVFSKIDFGSDEDENLCTFFKEFVNDGYSGYTIALIFLVMILFSPLLFFLYIGLYSTYGSLMCWCSSSRHKNKFFNCLVYFVKILCCLPCWIIITCLAYVILYVPFLCIFLYLNGCYLYQWCLKSKQKKLSK